MRSWRSKCGPMGMALAAALLMAEACGAAEFSWTEKSKLQAIDLDDITTVPIGATLQRTDGLMMPTNGADTVVYGVDRKGNCGDCGALCVSGMIVAVGSRRILGAMGSCVYPSVKDGAFAVTNQLQTAVASASAGKATVVPLRIGQDGAGTITYGWGMEGRQVELVVKCFVNERRQMAVCCYIHTKGDDVQCVFQDGRLR